LVCEERVFWGFLVTIPAFSEKDKMKRIFLAMVGSEQFIRRLYLLGYLRYDGMVSHDPFFRKGKTNREIQDS